MRQFDVIVGGGSYAGLAAACQLGRRALVIDQHEIGAVQRSACAMPLAVVERFNARDAIIQRYDNLYFHDTRDVHQFPLGSPYCIIDHQIFCRSVFEQSDVTFTKARIRGIDGTRMVTSAGELTAPLFIDATGWPRVLARRGGSGNDPRRKLTVGIEADVPGQDEGLHIYYVPEIVPKGYGWVFPAADELRIGVGSYDRRLDMKAVLRRFLQHLGVDGKPSRGGMIPWFSGEPVVGNVFAAGDSAGHCLPLTAEGIRLALGFGDAAGRIMRQVVDGEMTLAEGSDEYLAVSRLHRRSYAVMRVSQRLVGTVPGVGIHLVARGLSTERVRSGFLGAYLSLGAEQGRAA